MTADNTTKFQRAIKAAIDSKNDTLLQAAAQGRRELYIALRKVGLSWDRVGQVWIIAPPKRSKFVDANGCATGKFTVRITTHASLMNAVADRLERSLTRRGCKIIQSSNFVKSKKGDFVHVFISAQWPTESEDEE